jgi:hypothetical protein
MVIAIEVLLPLLAGALFALSDEKVNTRLHFLCSSFVYGQIFIFAIFQPVFVFAILKGFTLTKAIKIFLPFCAAMVLLLVAIAFMKYRKRLAVILKSKCEKPDLFGVLGVIIFGIMIVMSFFVTYYDGDDAYYVAMASQSESSDAMYATEPYTGGLIRSPYRYLFAPFPIWIAFLSRITGARTVAVAHSYLPWFMIFLSFAVFYLCARAFFGDDKKKRGVFMFFASVLVLFGDYSIYTPENFLLARSRQGKAALASFVLPFLTYLLFELMKEFDDRKKVSPVKYLMIMLTGMAAALCSTMGGMVVCALTGAFALVMLVMYRKIKVPVIMLLSSAPCLVFIVLYLYMRRIVP